jgi:hypothetical protein
MALRNPIVGPTTTGWYIAPMPTVTRKELSQMRSVSERTLKRIMPELELGGKVKPIARPGKGREIEYDLAEVTTALDEYELTHPALRSSNRWQAAHPGNWTPPPSRPCLSSHPPVDNSPNGVVC